MLAGLGLGLRYESGDSFPTAEVRRAPLTISIVERACFDRPSANLRSRVAGREIEIVWLAPEGQRVNQNDPVIRLDTTNWRSTLNTPRRRVRQAQLDLQVAEAGFRLPERRCRRCRPQRKRRKRRGAVQPARRRDQSRTAERTTNRWCRSSTRDSLPGRNWRVPRLESEQAAATLEIRDDERQSSPNRRCRRSANAPRSTSRRKPISVQRPSSGCWKPPIESGSAGVDRRMHHPGPACGAGRLRRKPREFAPPQSQGG